MPEEHKAVMHPMVAEWFVHNFTKQGETILDPFMGLGTTAIACANAGRNYIGFEISAEYCKMAEDRIYQQTSQQRMI